MQIQRGTKFGVSYREYGEMKVSLYRDFTPLSDVQLLIFLLEEAQIYLNDFGAALQLYL